MATGGPGCGIPVCFIAGSCAPGGGGGGGGEERTWVNLSSPMLFCSVRGGSVVFAPSLPPPPPYVRLGILASPKEARVREQRPMRRGAPRRPPICILSSDPSGAGDLDSERAETKGENIGSLEAIRRDLEHLRDGRFLSIVTEWRQTRYLECLSRMSGVYSAAAWLRRRGHSASRGTDGRSRVEGVISSWGCRRR